MAHLSKSDYKIARQCITKLYYKKKQYPSSDQGDPFMELLAEGGYMVGKLAQLLYPGKLVEGMETALEKTRQFMQEKEVCIHEATIESRGKLARIDILNKKGQRLELIEVKSKSWDSNRDNFSESKVFEDFREYLEDIAFQYLVLSEAYPGFTIKPYLFLPDKAKRTNIEGLNSMFRIKSLPETGNGFRGYEVEFTGDVKTLRKDDIMTRIDVSAQIKQLLPDVKKESARFLSTLQPKLKKSQAPISIQCNGCEYRLSNAHIQPNGFAECWGKNAYANHHILDLTRLGNINRVAGVDINAKIAQGLRSYKKLNPEPFKGKYHNRPYYQVKTDQEVIVDGLREQIQFKYPICFIDFEVSKMALPYHKGMRPYENVAFQWSCHTLNKNGNLTHKDWINVKEAFPNFQFAESLMQHIKNAGTVLIWSSYENTILKSIYEQMDLYKYKNPDLKKWLKTFVKFDDTDTYGFIDLAKIANKHYHHPMAMGRYGIKWLLPAVLKEAKSKKIVSWLSQIGLYKKAPDGTPEDPYSLLPVIEVGSDAQVKDGTGAIRAYQDMMYGLHRDNPAVKAKWEDALRQYCRLDTLAMVIILEYWQGVL